MLPLPPRLKAETRFLDILEATEDPEDDLLGELPDLCAFAAVVRQESSHGPLHWNTHCGHELQRVVDTFRIEHLDELPFSVTVADPAQPDCPLVACSTGFTELTGYAVQEIVGRNCRFLLNGVPPNLINGESRIKCREFCLSIPAGEENYSESTEQLPEGIAKPWIDLAKGEFICVQTNARKSGELFRNMFYLKQVELNDAIFILGLQAGLPDGFEDDTSMGDLEKKCRFALGRLEKNLSAIEQVLAQQFWYSASMRRQI